jgi:hypothetical protein
VNSSKEIASTGWEEQIITVLAYMSERFRYKRLEGQAKNTVVNGFFGVS